MGKQYDQLGAAKYEAMMDLVKFNEMEEICKEIGSMEVNRDEFEVMDIGAGSGRVGRQLQKQGYKKIDAVDASEGLLEHAKKTGAYRNCVKTFLGNGTYPFEEHRDHYDLVASSGVWLSGHIPAAGMDEVVQCLKKGGKWVTAMRTIYYAEGHAEGYREQLEKLQDEGLITLVKQYTFDRGVPGHE